MVKRLKICESETRPTGPYKPGYSLVDRDAGEEKGSGGHAVYTSVAPN